MELENITRPIFADLSNTYCYICDEYIEYYTLDIKEVEVLEKYLCKDVLGLVYNYIYDLFHILQNINHKFDYHLHRLTLFLSILF